MTNRKSRVMFRVALCVLSILGIGTGVREVPAQAETTTRLQMPLWANVGSKSPGAKPDGRVAGALRSIAREFDGWKAAPSQQAPAADFRPRHALAPVGGGYVTIDAVADGNAGVLVDNLTALGLRHGAVSGRLVSGRLPLAALSALEAMPGMTAARPAYLRRRAGAVTSEGDAALVADGARSAWGVDGSGVTVGVLSDSFDCQGGASDGARSGDLPAVITVLREGPCADDPDEIDAPLTDEGRAMLEIVHDIAPGAALAFHTAEGGQANFARGILALCTPRAPRSSSMT